jgi:chromosome segregation ATPase
LKNAGEIEGKTGKDKEIFRLKKELNKVLKELNELRTVFFEKIEENQDLDDQIELKRIETIDLRREINKLENELNQTKEELEKCKKDR